MNNIYLDGEGVRTLWAAVKTELTKKVNNTELENYLNSEETEAAILTALAPYATTSEMNSAIASAIAGLNNVTMQIVETLPETGEERVIYLVPTETGEESNAYDEWMWIDSKWELVGSTKVDLSAYWAKAELTAITQAELEEILV